ncbi:MAG TPA: hypothetical protein VJ836_00115 [Candidatus Saccharimonadales bacterium]|nr:hypothetical protein [Candidatus Saccharimonadales bacterium]
MNPEQPLTPPSQNPYEFIMNPEKPPKPKKSFGPSSSFVMKLLLILGGIAVLMILIAVVVNVVFGSRTNVEDFVQITKTEQELIRVSALGKKAGSQSVRNAATNTHFTVTTHQQQWLFFLGQKGRKLKEKELKLSQNVKTDAKLTTAQQTATFDPTFTTVMREHLQSYAAELQDAYTNATDPKARALLAAHHEQAEMLLTQWPTQ